MGDAVVGVGDAGRGDDGGEGGDTGVGDTGRGDDGGAAGDAGVGEAGGGEDGGGESGTTGSSSDDCNSAQAAQCQSI